MLKGAAGHLSCHERLAAHGEGRNKGMRPTRLTEDGDKARRSRLHRLVAQLSDDCNIDRPMRFAMLTWRVLQQAAPC